MVGKASNLRGSYRSMVGFGNVGSDDLTTPARRARKRSRVIELCLFLLQHEPNGLRIQHLQKIVDQSFRFRCSSNSIGQYLMPLVERGILEKETTVSGNISYRYIPDMETGDL